MKAVFLYDTRSSLSGTKMKDDKDKPMERPELTLRPISVVKWILMLALILFFVYMLLPKVAYS
jgi:hypothetical protein